MEQPYNSGAAGAQRTGREGAGTGGPYKRAAGTEPLRLPHRLLTIYD